MMKLIQSKPSAGVIGLIFAMMFGLLAGCGTTVEKQQARFKKNTDTMQALAAKNPMMRAPVMAKMADFQAEHDKVVAAGGENAPTELARLNSRVEEYVRKLDPSMAPKTTTTTPGKKLGAPTGAAPGTAAPGGKLGGTPPAAAPGMAPGAAPGMAPAGKLGGTAPGAAPGMAPAGKLGGTAPGAAPGMAPAGKLGGTATGTAPGAAPAGKLGGAAPGAAPGTAPSGKLGGQ